MNISETPNTSSPIISIRRSVWTAMMTIRRSQKRPRPIFKSTQRVTRTSTSATCRTRAPSLRIRSIRPPSPVRLLSKRHRPTARLYHRRYPATREDQLLFPRRAQAVFQRHILLSLPHFYRHTRRVLFQPSRRAFPPPLDRPLCPPPRRLLNRRPPRHFCPREVRALRQRNSVILLARRLRPLP